MIKNFFKAMFYNFIGSIIPTIKKMAKILGILSCYIIPGIISFFLFRELAIKDTGTASVVICIFTLIIGTCILSTVRNCYDAAKYMQENECTVKDALQKTKASRSSFDYDDY